MFTYLKWIILLNNHYACIWLDESDLQRIHE